MRGNLILDTSYPKRGSRLVRKRNVGDGAVRQRMSSPEWRACAPTVVRSKVSHTSNYDEFGASGERFFVSSCCVECIYGPAHAYRCRRRNREGGPQYPRVRSLLSDTRYRKRGGRPAGTRNERHGAVVPRIPPPSWRGCPPTAACSKIANTNIYDEFGVGGRCFFV